MHTLKVNQGCVRGTEHAIDFEEFEGVPEDMHLRCGRAVLREIGLVGEEEGCVSLIEAEFLAPVVLRSEGHVRPSLAPSASSESCTRTLPFFLFPA